MERDFCTTMLNLIAVIPNGETLKNQLENYINVNNLPYKPSEVWWSDTNEIIWAFIPPNPHEWKEWQKYFISILSTKGISEIKSVTGD